MAAGNYNVYVVDASVWVSRFVPGDVHHEPSYHWLEGVVARGDLLVAPAPLLVEVAGAVSGRTGHPELATRAVDLLEQLPISRLVPVDAQLARLAAELAGRYRLRGGDILYVALANRLGFPLVTWDREQAKRGSGATPVFTPQDVTIG